MPLPKILTLLNAPHPPHFDLRAVLRNAAISGVVVALVLAGLQPFELSELPDGLAVPISLGFGGVTFIVVVLIGYVLPKILPSWFNEDNWTVWRNVLHTVVVVMLIGLGNLLYLQLLGYYNGSFWQALGYIELYTFAIAIFPIAFLTLVEQNKQLKKHAARAEAANAFHAPREENSEDEVLVFLNEQGRPELRLPVAEWWFIRADKNYLDIYFAGKDGKPEKHVLRNRLSKVCETLDHPAVFHSHRSYAVNMHRVRRIEGNARGYSLYLDAEAPPIPVSRSKTEQLFELFEGSR